MKQEFRVKDFSSGIMYFGSFRQDGGELTLRFEDPKLDTEIQIGIYAETIEVSFMGKKRKEDNFQPQLGYMSIPIKQTGYWQDDKPTFELKPPAWGG